MVAGLHYYTLNRSRAARRVYETLVSGTAVLSLVVNGFGPGMLRLVPICSGYFLPKRVHRRRWSRARLLLCSLFFYGDPCFAVVLINLGPASGATGEGPLGRSLLAVNVVLSALFIFQLESPARGGAVDPRPRGSYLMVTSTMKPATLKCSI